ncbi:MAG: OsmC family protein [Bacteroidota bacterium]
MSMHNYTIQLEWTGNKGSGTLDYRAYSRDHELGSSLKTVTIPGTSDPKFRGDASRYNPEELLIASLSACHMLWYLHLCADHGVIVLEYTDEAEGTMRMNADGSGQFEKVTLKPRVQVSKASMIKQAQELHELAHEKCFISRSVGFEVGVEGEVKT